MKLLLLISFFCILFINNGFSQNEIDFEKTIGFGCSYSGESSPPVNKVSTLLNNRDYQSIIKLLESKNPAEQYLAVLSIKYLERKGVIQIENAHQLIIQEIHNSKEILGVCSGCTMSSNVPLGEFLSEEYEEYWHIEVEDMVDRSLREISFLEKFKSFFLSILE